jgi:hypothetical protein
MIWISEVPILVSSPGAAGTVFSVCAELVIKR